MTTLGTQRAVTETSLLFLMLLSVLLFLTLVLMVVFVLSLTINWHDAAALPLQQNHSRHVFISNRQGIVVLRV